MHNPQLPNREAMTDAARKFVGDPVGAHPWHIIDRTIDAILALIPSPDQGEADFKRVPLVPTEAQWGGLARAIMMWLDMSPKTPRALFQHLRRIGEDVPDWLRDEPGMKNLDHVPSKGTRCVIIYRAMVEAYSAALATPPVDSAKPGEEIERLTHVIDRDRYVAALCLNLIEGVLSTRRHLAEPGRGSYSYDDEGYQREFGLALDEIRGALVPLRQLAADKTDCTTDPEKVVDARLDGAERFAALSASLPEPQLGVER